MSMSNDPLIVEIRDEVLRIRAACGYPSSVHDFGWTVKQGKYQAVRIVFIGKNKSKRTRVEPLTDPMSAIELLAWLKEQIYFIHHPTLEDLTAWINPLLTSDLWKQVWDIAKAQPWYVDGLVLLGGDGNSFYFMKSGVRSGMARVQLKDPIAEAMQNSVVARARGLGVRS